jgi:protease I
VDEELVTDEADGWTLITSRSPEDLPAFTGAITSIG